MITIYEVNLFLSAVATVSKLHCKLGFIPKLYPIPHVFCAKLIYTENGSMSDQQEIISYITANSLEDAVERTSKEVRYENMHLAYVNCNNIMKSKDYETLSEEEKGYCKVVNEICSTTVWEEVDDVKYRKIMKFLENEMEFYEFDIEEVKLVTGNDNNSYILATMKGNI